MAKSKGPFRDLVVNLQSMTINVNSKLADAFVSGKMTDYEISTLNGIVEMKVKDMIKKGEILFESVEEL